MKLYTSTEVTCGQRSNVKVILVQVLTIAISRGRAHKDMTSSD